MKVTLRIFGGPNDGRSTQVQQNQKITVGRSATADFAVVDLRMSRHHFQIDGHDGDWFLVDASSTNGTMVNGKTTRNVKLAHNDTILAGDTTFQVKFDHDDTSVPDDHAEPAAATVDDVSSMLPTWSNEDEDGEPGAGPTLDTDPDDSSSS